MNLNVLLRGEGHTFGLVLFRQRADDPFIAHLNTFLFSLAPNTSYLLQRAVDAPDGSCTSEAWLTLGKGTTPQDIETSNRGFGHEELFRNLSAFPAGTSFDIHFRVIEAATGTPVLASGCYRFTIRG